MEFFIGFLIGSLFLSATAASKHESEAPWPARRLYEFTRIISSKRTWKNRTDCVVEIKSGWFGRKRQEILVTFTSSALQYYDGAVGRVRIENNALIHEVWLGERKIESRYMPGKI